MQGVVEAFEDPVLAAGTADGWLAEPTCKFATRIGEVIRLKKYGGRPVETGVRFMEFEMVKKSSLICFLFVFFAVPALHAQPLQRMQSQSRINLAVQLGIGGSADVEVDGNEVGEGDLNSTLGAMGEYLLPLHRVFALGARFQFFSVDPDGPGDNINHVAFSAVPKLRLPATPTMEVHLGVPLGLVIGFAPDDFPGDDTGFGFQWGFLLGGTLSVSPGIGIFGEAGLMAPSTTYSADDGLGGEVDITLTAQQFTFFAGVAIDM